MGYAKLIFASSLGWCLLSVAGEWIEAAPGHPNHNPIVDWTPGGKPLESSWFSIIRDEITSPLETRASQVRIWQTDRNKGFFSDFTLALTFIQQWERENTTATMIDWRGLGLYKDDSGSNVWEWFFEQPFAAARQNITGAKMIPIATNNPGSFPQGEGYYNKMDITKRTVDEGRRLTQTYVQLKPEFQQRVLEAKRNLLETKYKRPLAVHVRLTDKVSEAPDNFGMSYQELHTLITSHMAREGYDGFLFCTDAKDLKEFIAGQCGDKCVTYDSSLSDDGPAHKDGGIPNRKKAEDIVTEVLLMASCEGFVSTYSNVANGVLFFGSDELARNHQYLLRLKHKLLPHHRQ
eukprot:jgi/Bigna1/140802/aug1.58_g15510